MIATVLMAASASIIFVLGALHLTYTFHGPKLTPRDPALIEAMDAVSPVITSETTMWKTWIGFNASHSVGALLFGLVYGYLALVRGDVLFGSPFLLGVGLATLVAYFALGKRYWFSAPFTGIAVSLACFVASVVASRF